jgi:hypothetical protein
MLTTLVLIVLIILVVGAIPGAWPHSKDWGRGPIGVLTLLLIIVLILMLVGGCVPAPVPPIRP